MLGYLGSDHRTTSQSLTWVHAGILVMIVLLCLTPVFRNMPQNAQAAVIIAAVIGLFRYDEWFFLWKVAPLTPFPVFLPLIVTAEPDQHQDGDPECQIEILA